ncbi:CLUMA_CG004320, isoform A [Clunio marinus]|uniref:CLUMA_CG004320, isoform A n=1 Tax=Clunio marinus TaxID=568069 RepID=A0A1J1HSU5_9DIPT|nr:CLUMA_CG004320, isoform A [Clunio marinus]
MPHEFFYKTKKSNAHVMFKIFGIKIEIAHVQQEIAIKSNFTAAFTYSSTFTFLNGKQSMLGKLTVLNSLTDDKCHIQAKRFKISPSHKDGTNMSLMTHCRCSGKIRNKNRGWINN